jgi:cyclophilin family peptidyl-prolyl cis-trans isomerase/protein-disulfide isomerase
VKRQWKRFLWFLATLALLVSCGEKIETGPRVDVTASTAPPPVLTTEVAAGLNNPPTNAVEPRDYILGPDDAYVTIIMYADFQCIRCARYARDLEILRSRYPDDLRLIWRHLPDTQSNDKAALALQAAEAAAAQGRFWDMQAILFTTQPEWIDLSPEAFRGKLTDFARTAGLDVQRFDRELDEEHYEPLVEQYQAQADALQIVGIPTLLLNGTPLSDRDDLFGLEGAVRLALLARDFFATPPPFTLDLAKDYQAVIETEKGDIHVNLFEQQAPQTVNNFVFLARQGWYDGNTFFLVVPDFYAQTGDPSDTGRGYPGYRLVGEQVNDLIFDREGLVAMSHPSGEPDAAGSIFFITFGPLPNHEAEWDGRYTIFGVVTEGMDAVRSLTPRNPGDPLRFPNPPPGDLIRTIRIEEQARP